MKCHNCGKENPPGSIFCRHCGAQLKKDVPRSADASFYARNVKLIWILVAVVLLLSVGTAYAAPKISDYLAVNADISNAKQLSAKGDFTDALDSLNAAQNKWTLQSDKKELTSLQAQENGYLQDQTNFNTAVSEEGSGNLNGAQQLLQSIAADFPQYSSVQTELTSVQSQIESQLQNQAQQAEDQATQAQAEASAAQTAKAQAEAQAAQAAKDKAAAQATAADEAQAQAQANASAEASAAAQAQAQAAEQQQVLLSFYNQLGSIYSNLNSGVTYWNNAIDDLNEANNFAALAAAGQAQSIFQTSYSNAIALNGNFTGLPSAYVNAGLDMSIAANDCLQATNIFIGNIANSTNVDVSGDTDQCNTLKTDVGTFLQVTTP